VTRRETRTETVRPDPQIQTNTDAGPAEWGRKNDAQERRGNDADFSTRRSEERNEIHVSRPERNGSIRIESRRTEESSRSSETFHARREEPAVQRIESRPESVSRPQSFERAEREPVHAAPPAPAQEPDNHDSGRTRRR
jgi:hypothetical protein